MPRPTERQLPKRPDLKQLKHQAKDLLRSFQRGDPATIAEFAERHPRQPSPNEPTLSDAQLVLARSYGQPSWPRLVAFVHGARLRRGIWEGDEATVAEVLNGAPEAAAEAGPHPMWGGEPTALQVAAERGDVGVIRRLLDSGADPNGGNAAYGWTPLQLAGHWAHTAAAELLRERGATVDVFAAALLGDADRVERLLSANPSLAHTPGLNDASPLHAASTPAVAECLIRHGSPLDETDALGNTPVGSALNRGDRGLAVVRVLLNQGAATGPHALAALGLVDRLAETIDENPKALGSMAPIGLNAVVGTPLHAAACRGRVDAVRWLIDRGADPNARADRGQTPLHLGRDAATARALVEAGADPNAQDNEHHTTPLAWARVAQRHWRHGDPTVDELIAYLESVTREPEERGKKQ